MLKQPILNKTHFNIFYALIASFYSKKLYQAVRSNWRKKVFLYLFVLIAILLVPFSIRFLLNAEQVLTRLVAQVSIGLPVLNINNGVAKVEPNRLYQFDYPGTAHKFAIIDLNESYHGFPFDEAIFLVGRHAIQAKTQTYSVKVYPYDKKWNVTLGPKQLATFFEKNKIKFLIIILVAIYTMGLLFAYLLYLLYSYLLGVFTTIAAKHFSLKLSFKENLRLTIVALTPGALLLVLLYLFQMLNFSVMACLLVLQIGYAAFAVFSCQESKGEK